MKRAEHSSALSALAPARVKIILLGPSGPHLADWINQGRSLNLEHVSPALLVQQEISRRTPSGQQAAAAITRPASAREADQLHLALLRKWFWARKPDAGFLLEGFPATLLQALVFDEWLEARGENLTAVLPASRSSTDLSSLALAKEDPVITHYRTQGLLGGDLNAAA